MVDAEVRRHQRGVGVVRDEHDDAIRPTLPREVEGAVERMESGAIDAGGVTNVVQPGSCHDVGGVGVLQDPREVGSRERGRTYVSQAHGIVMEQAHGKTLSRD